MLPSGYKISKLNYFLGFVISMFSIAVGNFLHGSEVNFVLSCFFLNSCSCFEIVVYKSVKRIDNFIRNLLLHFVVLSWESIQKIFNLVFILKQSYFFFTDKGMIKQTNKRHRQGIKFPPLTPTLPSWEKLTGNMIIGSSKYFVKRFFFNAYHTHKECLDFSFFC